jgi:hypothetical protein
MRQYALMLVFAKEESWSSHGFMNVDPHSSGSALPARRHSELVE